MIVIERRRVLLVTGSTRLVFTGPDRLMRALAYASSL